MHPRAICLVGKTDQRSLRASHWRTSADTLLSSSRASRINLSWSPGRNHVLTDVPGSATRGRPRFGESGVSLSAMLHVSASRHGTPLRVTTAHFSAARHRTARHSTSRHFTTRRHDSPAHATSHHFMAPHYSAAQQVTPGHYPSRHDTSRHYSAPEHVTTNHPRRTSPHDIALLGVTTIHHEPTTRH